MRRDRIHALSADENLSRGRIFKAGQHAHESCLAAARGAEQGKKFALIDFERYIVDSGKVAKAFGEIADLN